MKRTNKPIVIGLTGSLAMGKSTATRMFKTLGAAVFCADKAVHEILKHNHNTQKRIINLFPECLWAGRMSRKRLGNIVFGKSDEIKKLERILHPYIEKQLNSFIKKNNQAKIILLDIPLLFEKGWHKKCDFTVCVACSLKTQKERALRRKTMNEKKLKNIVKKQMNLKDKKRMADFVISSEHGLKQMRKEIHTLWDTIHA